MISEKLLKLIKNIQIKLDNKFWNKDISKNEKILSSCVKMSEEIGELSAEVLKKLGKARKEKLEKYSDNDLKLEFADGVLSILLLAEQMGVDMNEALEMKFKKIENRGGI